MAKLKRQTPEALKREKKAREQRRRQRELDEVDSQQRRLRQEVLADEAIALLKEGSVRGRGGKSMLI
jgi:hypothetical protein